MGQRGVLRTLEGNLLAFFCPDCQCTHHVRVAPHPHAWGFNGNYEAPTFTPSVLVEGVERLTDEQYARIMAGEKIEPKPTRCHSSVTDGSIQYFGDCTHAMRGRTIQLQPF